jgi:hypothetical protein
MLMLTFHPHIIGHRSRMAQLESLHRPHAVEVRSWFAAAEQIAQ